MSNPGKLSIVATPIGNLEDITLRALRVLSEADLILCEDTRHTKHLLDHYEIKKPLRSYHAHSSDGEENAILQMIAEGKHLGLVCDAGTPGISDPGVVLISRVLSKFGSDAVALIPGPSALTGALARSGIPSHQVLFAGFAPAKKGRQTFFSEISKNQNAVVFYESSHKLAKTFAELAKVLSPNRIVVLCRELTKMHEETVRMNARSLSQYLETNPIKTKGEHVVIIAPEDFYLREE